jgi:hypothetical protein
VSADKLSRKIAWKKYGTQMQSTVLEARCDVEGSPQLVVPLQTTYFIPVDGDDRAYSYRRCSTHWRSERC